MSAFCWSLNPRTVKRARIVRSGCRALEGSPLLDCRVLEGSPLPDSPVGTSYLNLITQRQSIMFRAWRRGLRLKHLS